MKKTVQGKGMVREYVSFMLERPEEEDPHQALTLSGSTRHSNFSNGANQLSHRIHPNHLLLDQGTIVIV